jgi:hypothetical protein
MPKQQGREPHPDSGALAAVTPAAAGALAWSWRTGRLDHAIVRIALSPAWPPVGARRGDGWRPGALRPPAYSRAARPARRGHSPALRAIRGAALLVRAARSPRSAGLVAA